MGWIQHLYLCTLYTRRGIKVCQKTVPKDTIQGTERVNQEARDDPPGSDVAQNPSIEMGFVNRAVSIETVDDSGYARLQRPTESKLQKPQNPVRESQDYSEYMVPQDLSDEYEEVLDSRRS